MQKKSFIIHPYLIALFNILFYYANNLGKVKLNSVIAPVFIVLPLTLLADLILSKLIKNRKSSAVVLSVFIMLFFSFGHAFQALKTHVHIPFIRNDMEFTVIFLTGWAGAFLLAAYYIIKMNKVADMMDLFFSVMSCVLLLMPVSSIVIWETTLAHGRYSAVYDEERADKNLEGKSRDMPDIYLIILDAYAGSAALRDYYGYDNSVFIKYLRSRGFFVAENSYSNYCQTGLTLASLLNLQYLDNDRDRLEPGSSDRSSEDVLIRNSRAFRLLKKRGYTIAVISSGRRETMIESADYLNIPKNGPDEFQNMLINATPLPIILNLIDSQSQFDAHRNRILEEFDLLADMCNMPDPVFVLAHIEAPHPPFVFGRNGEKVGPEILFQENDGDKLIGKGRLKRNEYVKYYTDQLSFINKKTEVLIDNILAASKIPPVIVLQGDHGPRSMLFWESPEKTNFKECMSILSAYYLPSGSGMLYPSVSPVNTLRILFNEYFETGYTILEDQSFFSTESNPYRFIDVTDKIRSGQSTSNTAPAGSS